MKNGYPKHFVDITINKFGKKNYPSTQSNEVCTVVIPYVKGISVKFNHIGNKYNIKTIFKTKHTLRNIFIRTKPDTKSQLRIRHCFYSIPCECGRSYIGEMSRPLGIHIKEHKHNLKQGLLEKSKLTQHSYEEGYRIKWDEAKAIQKEQNTTYRKCKESDHMAYLENTISQPQPGVVTFLAAHHQRRDKKDTGKWDMWIVSSFSSLFNVVVFLTNFRRPPPPSSFVILFFIVIS
jgi:hypothetical protein